MIIEMYDHCMPECFKDIPWCQKLHQGMAESRARNELCIPKQIKSQVINQTGSEMLDTHYPEIVEIRMLNSPPF